MANETAYFEIQVKNLEQLVQLTSAVKGMESSFKGVVSEFKNLSNSSDAASRKIKDDFNTNKKSVEGFGVALTGANRLLTLFSAGLGIAGLGDFTKSIFHAASTIKALKLSLENLLGVTSGKNLFEELKKFTLTSPFTFEQTIKGVNQLVGSMKALGLSSSVIARDVIPTFTSLSNSAAALGGGDRFDRLTYAFTQVQAAGSLMGTEVRQIAETGFPLLAVLSDKLGISVSAVKDRISEGSLSFKEFEKAILSAGAGVGEFGNKFQGVFAGAMAIQLKTTEGQYNNLKDTILFALGNIGDKFTDTANSAIKFTSALVNSLFGTKEATERTLGVISELIKGFLALKVVTTAVTLATDLYIASKTRGLAASVAQALANFAEWVSNGRLAASKAALVAADEALLIAKGELILADEALTLTENQLTLSTTRETIAAQANATTAVADAEAKVLQATATRGVASSTATATSAMTAFKLSLGAVVIVATALYVAYEYLKERTDKVNRAHSEESKTLLAAQGSIRAQVGYIETLTGNQTKRRVEIERLINKYPEYFKGLDIERVSNNQLNEIYKKVNISLQSRIKLSDEAYRIELREKQKLPLLEKQLELQDKINERKGTELSVDQQIAQIRSKKVGNANTVEEAELLRAQKEIDKINTNQIKAQEALGVATKKRINGQIVALNQVYETTKLNILADKELSDIEKNRKIIAARNIRRNATRELFGKEATFAIEKTKLEQKEEEKAENARIAREKRGAAARNTEIKREEDQIKSDKLRALEAEKFELELGDGKLKNLLDIIEKEKQIKIQAAEDDFNNKKLIGQKKVEAEENAGVERNKAILKYEKANIKTIEDADKEKIKLLTELEVAKKAIVQESEDANLAFMKASELSKADSEEAKYQISIKYDELEFELRRKRILEEIQDNNNQVAALEYSVDFKKQKAAENIKLILKEGKEREEAIKLSNEAIDKENDNAILKIEADTQKHYKTLLKNQSDYNVKKIDQTTKNNDRIKSDTQKFLDIIKRIEENNKIARLKTIESFLKNTQTSLKAVAQAYGNFGGTVAKSNASFILNLVETLGQVRENLKATISNLKSNREEMAKLKKVYDENVKNLGNNYYALIGLTAKYNEAKKKLEQEQVTNTLQVANILASTAINVIGAASKRQTEIEIEQINARISNTRKEYDDLLEIQRKGQAAKLLLMEEGFQKEEDARNQAQFKKDAKIEADAAAERNKILSKQAEKLSDLIFDKVAVAEINKKAADEEIAFRDLYRESLNSTDLKRKAEAEAIVNEGVQKMKEVQVQQLSYLAVNGAATAEIQKQIDVIKTDALKADLAIRAKYAKDIASLDKGISDKAKEAQAVDITKLKDTTKEKIDTLLVEKAATKLLVEERTETVGKIQKEASDAIVKVDQKEKADLFNSGTSFNEVELAAKTAHVAAIKALKIQQDKDTADLEYEKNYKMWILEKERIDADYRLKLQELKIQQGLAAVSIGIQVAIMTATYTAIAPLVGILLAAGVAAAVYAVYRKIPDPPKPEYPAEPVKPFFKGTDNTSRNAPRRRVDNLGGFQAILHPDEQIFSKEQVDKMTMSNGGVRMTRNEVMNKVMNFDNLTLKKGYTPQIINRMQNDNSKLEKEIKGLRRDLYDLQSKPKVSVNIDGSGHSTYLTSKSRNVQVLRNRYKHVV